MKKKNRIILIILTETAMSLLKNLKISNLILTFFLLSEILIVSFLQAAETQPGVKQKQVKPYRGEVETEGYVCIYEAVNPKKQGDEIFFQSKITIRNKNSDILYLEIVPFQPGMCSGFPPLSKLAIKNLPVYKLLGGNSEKERWLFVMCGSYAGRHQTIKVFFNDPISLKTTALHFGDSEPNLFDIDGDGLYESEVCQRFLFPDIGYGVDCYLTVYKLKIDPNLFGFIPTFGPQTIKPYADYYTWLKKSLTQENLDDKLGPMLAALLATQDKNKICEEIKFFALNGLTIKDLETWEKRVKELGYPGFNFNSCKEGLK